MKWYYSENGTQAGPVDETALHSLVSSGQLNPDSLVWREGMTDWKSYSQIPELIAPTSSPDGALHCSECGNAFANDDLISIGTSKVCATCKPIAIQKLKEGIETFSGDYRYAGFWIRFAAKFVDGLILLIPGFALNFLGSLLSQGAHAGTVTLGAVFGMIFGLVFRMAYNILFVWKYGATPGKMACGIKVITASGGPIGLGRSTGRAFSEILSSMILCIGYIMVGFDAEKRALHDRICDTRVIYK